MRTYLAKIEMIVDIHSRKVKLPSVAREKRQSLQELMTPSQVYMAQKSCTIAGFTKRSNCRKELMWTFDVDHVTRKFKARVNFNC